ncbi:amino acid adenylation domain-containing protein [Paenibacillus sp. QZ-Y1]|uniref:amino acid adenylation domain-containing protein n=1 Tax=Paenibacillus sp. QZ-Y1 TaxID=3414511 RepID=UPI003F7914E6
MIRKTVELSETQKGIYFDCQVEDPSSYNIAVTISMKELNVQLFRNAIELLVNEQEALRSSLEIQNDLPVLVIEREVPLQLIERELDATLNEVQKEQQLNLWLKEFTSECFMLNQAPLYRMMLVRTDNESYYFTMCVHHLICDGISLELMKNKIVDGYTRLVHGQTVDVYHDEGFSAYITEETKKLETGKYEKQRQFWMNKMQGAEPLTLPGDFSSVSRHKGNGCEIRLDLQESMVQEITQAAMDREVTVFMFYMGVFTVLMQKYTGKDDITYTSPFSHRPRLEYEESIGCFVHMLPMRFHVLSELTFETLLQQVSTEWMDTYRNIGYPNNLIVRDSGLQSQPGSPTLFDISFVYDAYEETDSLHTRVVDQDQVTFPGQLMFVLSRTPQGTQLKLQFKDDIFLPDTIMRMGERYLKLLEQVLASPEKAIGELSLLLDGEAERILHDYNQTSYFPYQKRHIADVFTEKVQRVPHRIALIEGELQQTYEQVNMKSNQLARRIVEMKTRENEAVGVQIRRSSDLVIALLAVLKAGCAFVPVDPDFPTARKQFILQDAGISILISTSYEEEDSLLDSSIIYVGEEQAYTGNSSNLDIQLDPHSLAYIMYTSGSTGKPKGVMIENHSVVNTLLDLDRRFPLRENDVYLLKTAYTFDVSATELFGWFMGEGTLSILEFGAEKDPVAIAAKVVKDGVTHINFVPTMFRLFLETMEIQESNELSSLRWIFVGGEAVTPDIIRKYKALGWQASLENVYGPTECTIWVSHYPLNEYVGSANIPIGYPLNESRWYVTGNKDELQPVGIPGELCLSGVGLARGYLNLEQITNEKFVLNPFFREGEDPEHFRYMYRTGDLVRWLPSGTIEYLGRMDFQVKIQGARLETGEIENVLSTYPGIIQTVVAMRKPENNVATLCAFYLSEKEYSANELREHLSKALPSYMIPAMFIHRTEFPHNSSGKMDRNALLADVDVRDESKVAFTPPATELEQTIAEVWAEVLGVARIGRDDHFFELGGNSFSVIQAHNKLKYRTGMDFPVTRFFDYPALQQFAQLPERKQRISPVKRAEMFARPQHFAREDIAIIGLSINVPGAVNIREFWNNLMDQRESIYFYSDEELRELGVDEEKLNSPRYVKAKGRANGLDAFDAAFFDYTPEEVRNMSPQFRLMYQGIWEALEDGGCDPDQSGKIGVFVGGSDDFEWYRNVLFNDEDYSNKYQAFTLSTNHFLATRMAYKLNLKGPAYTALTGCSSSLVTPHLACQSLMTGECDVAVAGGITVELPNEGGYIHEDGMMFSKDGHCRPFDAKASGTVFSNGMGIVVLKRASDAVRDRDHIYAVIKGSAINNDGQEKMNFLAPSIAGQAEVVRDAYRFAGIDPESVSYVEAHGTGTLLGDPIEVTSLTQAFDSDQKQFCYLGSVKGNVGHMDTAAGVVGLVKVALGLKHSYIPGTVNYEQPNPKINFSDTPFKVSSQGLNWRELSKGRLRAGINSFGVGGTNAHMVLEEAPMMEKSSPDDEINVMLFSAKSEYSLNETAEQIVKHLVEHSAESWSDAAWTLQKGRRRFEYRKALVVQRSWQDQPELLLKKLGEAKVHRAHAGSEPIYFMFPGQGSQYQGMGRDLYLCKEQTGIAPLFRRHADQVLALLQQDERKEITSIIYGHEQPERMNETKYSQFALFLTSYAIAMSLIEIGIQPDGLIGHSIGEIAAATVAGVFELADAVQLVRLRGSLMQDQEPGVMLAIMADADEVKPILQEGVWLSLVNTTGSCVIGGTAEAITGMEALAHSRGWKSIRVKTSHAFHTPMMLGAAEPFQRWLSTITFHTPQIPQLSNTSGTWAKLQDLMSPAYWVKHILEPVLFEDNLSELLLQERALCIEVGPGRTLGSLLKQHKLARNSHRVVNMLRHAKETEQENIYVNLRLAELWCEGLEPDWQVLKGSTLRTKRALPTYVFNKQPFPLTGIQFSVSSVDTSKPGARRTSMSDRHTVSSPLCYEGVVDELPTIVLECYRLIFGNDTIAVDDNFFSLGGDSLKAISLSSALKSRTGIRTEVADLFNHPTSARLADYLQSVHAPREEHHKIRAAEPMDHYPLSSAQVRMLTQTLMDPESVAYNLPSATFIDGPLDRNRVELALEKLVQKHQSLRTSFKILKDKAVQIVHPSATVQIGYTERSIGDKQEMDSLIHSLIRPFHLEQAPLMRVELVRLDELRHMLFFDVHHIVADGTSVEIITRDFNGFYFDQEMPDHLQYKDYAVWQQDGLRHGVLDKQRDFWLERLGTSLPLLELPLDYDRPVQRTMQGKRMHFTLAPSLTKQLHQLAETSEVTMYMVMLSLWNILLARQTGQEDIVIGTPVAGRSHEEWKDTTGMFVNMIAMRNLLVPEQPYAEFLQKLKGRTMEAFAHQDYPFDELVRVLGNRRELNRNPVFDVCFDYQNMEQHELEFGELKFSAWPIDTGTSTYDLLLTCQENKGNYVIEGYIEFATDLFLPDSVERMVSQLIELAEQIVREPKAPLHQYMEGSFSVTEVSRGILSGTKLDYDRTLLVHRMFEEQSIQVPDKIALIVSSGESFTYRQLNEKANLMAWKLIHLGVQRDEPIGILSTRDEGLIVMMLAVMKAGAAYVPLDPAFPQQRILDMVGDSGMKAMLCSEKYLGMIAFEGVKLAYDPKAQDERAIVNPVTDGYSADLASVIFTSGSTGRPKGVMISHSALVNFVQDIRHRGIFRHETDRVLSVTTMSFDIFGFETLTPLCTGHSFYLANELEQLDPALAAGKLMEHGATHILSTVSRIRAFAENPEFGHALSRLDCILTGGETFPMSLLRDLQQRSRAKIYNMYGPTETTIWSTVKELTFADSVSIGQPIANTQVLILNEAGKPEPRDTYGELCIAGHGLARGYWNRAEETALKFTSSPDVVGGRLYHTGDKAKILPNGDIELAGRLDQQVKIRGYRMELTEIEQAVLRHTSVREAVVKVSDETAQGKQLVLFYRLKPGKERNDADAEKMLRSWLGDCLPHYMIPTHMVRVEQFPFLPNGKLDRGALNIPLGSDLEKQIPFSDISLEQPVHDMSSHLTGMLTEAWREVLNRDHVSVNDRFFDIGGTSLGLILINNRLNSYLGKAVPLVKLFEHATIASLTHYLVGERESHHVNSVSPNLGIDAAQSKREYAQTGEELVQNYIAEHVGMETTEEKNMSPSQPVEGAPHRSADIAVIGMAGHFPQARNVDEFWDNLMQGREAIARLDEEDLLAAGVRAEDLNHPHYVRAKGVLEDTAYFDSSFFEYAYQESNMMDPQIRMLHQCAWEALEHAGCNPYDYEGEIGLFAGSGLSLPWMAKLAGRSGNFLSAFEAMTLNEKDYITTRVSYKLNLRGPSVTVQTACSTSLVAIHQAAESIVRGECDVALAGGVSISYPIKEGYVWHEGMIYSKDGHCKPFSEEASGTVSGNGCGMVVLKALDQALEDGDQIYAVIKGSAINNDGFDKIGYTAPSVNGQVKVISTALKKAGIHPEQISYLEAHGTGTKLGDPIEIEALRQSWSSSKSNYCALGSVKANIGHLDAAAGVAGFIKTVMTLYHRTVPPQIHYDRPNPMLGLEQSPFYINTEPKPFEDPNQILRAAVSSFGIGGTNAHIILEQPPVLSENLVYEPLLLLPFSAKSTTALERTYESVIDHIHTVPALLPQAAWTLQTGRARLKHRKTLVAVDGSVFNDETYTSSGVATEEKLRIVFILNGESGTTPFLAKELYASTYNSHIARMFRANVENMIRHFDIKDQYVIRQGMMSQRTISDKKVDCKRLFTVEYALFTTCLQLGIIPEAVMGQGVGELAGLVISGVILPEHAVQVLDETLEWDHGLGALAKALSGSSDSDAMVLLAQRVGRYIFGQAHFPLVFSSSSGTDRGLETLYMMTRQGWPVQQGTNTSVTDDSAISLIRSELDSLPGDVYLMKALGQCWCMGAHLDWEVLSSKQVQRKIPLPTYVFDPIVHEHDVSLGVLEFRTHEKTVAGSPLQPSSSSTSNKEKLTQRQINERLQAMWMEELGCESINPTDDFFRLGGHSLKAIALSAKMTEAFGCQAALEHIFNYPTLQSMTEWVEAQLQMREEATLNHSIMPVNQQPYYRTTSAQQRMYVVHEMMEGGVAYNLASFYMVKGELDSAKLRSVMDSLVQRHEAFRTRFEMMNGDLVQIVEEQVSSVVEMLESSEERIAEDMKRYVQPFELSKAPLIRIKLTRLAADRHVLFIDMHHIIADQSSIAVLLREFSSLYQGERIEPLTIQYKDYAEWQYQQWAEEKRDPRSETFWRNEFSDQPAVVELLTDYTRQRNISSAGGRLSFTLEPSLSRNIQELCSQRGITPYMFFMGSLHLLLWKYTGQNDIVVGTAVAGRGGQAELNNVIGMFVNMLAVRTPLDERMKIDHYLDAVKAKMLACYEHQDYPYELLVEQLGLVHESNRNPLFDIVLNYIHMGTEELAAKGLELEPWYTEQIEAKFDMTWTVIESEGNYKIELEYKSALFEHASMELMGEKMENLLLQITSDVSIELSQLTITSPEEAQWLIYDINDNAVSYPRDATIIDMFEEQVEQNGNRPALIWDGGEMTYVQLHEAASKLAAWLADRHFTSGSRIALLLDRGPIQAISIFATLMAGLVYVPIDPSFPASRIRFMLDDCSACMALTESDYMADWAEEITCVVTQDILKSVDPAPPALQRTGSRSVVATDPAYILYTSGSTGKPKGALMSHRGVVKVMKVSNFVTVVPEDRILQVSNYGFDGAIFDFFGSLLNGAALMFITKDIVLDMERLSQIIREWRVSVFFITTSLFNVLVDWDVTCLKHVRKVMFGGEAASVTHANKALAYVGPDRLLNVYGPTETTYIASYYLLKREGGYTEPLPISQALLNTSLYVLDSQLRPVPPNVPGELYIGGDGIGIGYINRDDLTQKHFVKDPFHPGTMMYRTGDIVRRMIDGTLMFIERSDFQVKIRGFRIELLEVKHRLEFIPGVRAAMVIADKDSAGSTYIGAYFTTDPGVTLSAQDIRKVLMSELPEYMIPSKMLWLEDLPLNANGKVDRNALPSLEGAAITPAITAEPGTGMERKMLLAMQQVLAKTDFGISDNFFDHGGHSLKAISFTQMMSKEGIYIKVNELFQYPTIKGLACLPHIHRHQSTQGIDSLHTQSPTITPQNNLLHEQQIESLLHHIDNSCSIMSSFLDAADKIGTFALSAIQLSHVSTDSRASGFTRTIEGALDERQIRRIVVQVIVQHQLLHSMIDEDAEGLRWKQIDIVPVMDLLGQMIPYIDVHRYITENQKQLEERLVESLLQANYTHNELPWKLCILRTHTDRHRLIWGFDHLAFDGMSAEVIAHELERLASQVHKYPEDVPDISQISLRKYEDYTALLAQGPDNISVEEIIQRYELKEWSFYNEEAMRELGAFSAGLSQEITVELPLTESGAGEDWWPVFTQFARVITEYLGTAQLPLALVHYGREYHGVSFYHHVGEFLDLVPVLIDEAFKHEDLIALLDVSKRRGIHFMSLLNNEAFARTYAPLREYLSHGYDPQQANMYEMVLFNYQGFVSREDAAPFESSHPNLGATSHLARFEWIIRHDEHNWYVQMGCASGLDLKHMQQLVATHVGSQAKLQVQNKVLEVEHVQ